MSRSCTITLSLIFISLFHVLAASSDTSEDLHLFQRRAMLIVAAESSDGTPADTRPDLLVLATTRSAAAKMLSNALSKHPCVISIGDSFGGDEMLYAPWGDVGNQSALFRNHSEPDPKGTFHLLANRINDSVKEGVHFDSDLHIQAGSIKDFFEAVRKASCANYNLVDACGGRCILAHNIFPEDISNDFEQVQPYLADARTAVIHLMTNGTEIAASKSRQTNCDSGCKSGPGRDIAWHSFLTNLFHNLGNDNVWHQIRADDFVPSSDVFFQSVRRIFQDFQLDDESLVAPIRSFVERKDNL